MCEMNNRSLRSLRSRSQDGGGDILAVTVAFHLCLISNVALGGQLRRFPVLVNLVHSEH